MVPRSARPVCHAYQRRCSSYRWAKASARVQLDALHAFREGHRGSRIAGPLRLPTAISSPRCAAPWNETSCSGVPSTRRSSPPPTASRPASRSPVPSCGFPRFRPRARYGRGGPGAHAVASRAPWVENLGRNVAAHLRVAIDAIGEGEAPVALDERPACRADPTSRCVRLPPDDACSPSPHAGGSRSGGWRAASNSPRPRRSRPSKLPASPRREAAKSRRSVDGTSRARSRRMTDST